MLELFVSVKCSFSLCLEMAEFGTGMPIAFARHQLSVSDRMGQVLLLYKVANPRVVLLPFYPVTNS